VESRDGRPPATGEIAGREVPGSSSSRDNQGCSDGGGSEGLQAQPMLAGRSSIDPRPATVEIKETSTVPAASVGVVSAQAGDTGVVSGVSRRHGDLVIKVQRAAGRRRPASLGRAPRDRRRARSAGRRAPRSSPRPATCCRR